MIKVGIIGTGIIAREHAAAIAMIPQEAVLVAAADVSAERLNDFSDTFKVSHRYATAAELIADPQVQHLKMRVDVPHPKLGSVGLIRGGLSLSDTPLSIHSCAPDLGEHNEEVLAPLRKR